MFGTCVLVLPQRQTGLVAKQAAQLAILSGNRFRMGIGVGWNTVEFEALDVAFTHRGSRQAEQVELMRRLWTEDSVKFQGDYHTIDGASILPRPSRPVPVWFGGGAPAVLRRCARLGDGWVPVGTPNEQSRRAIATIRTAREAAGLPWGGFRHTGPGADQGRRPGQVEDPPRPVAGSGLHPSRHRHPLRGERDQRGRPPRGGGALFRGRARLNGRALNAR